MMVECQDISVMKRDSLDNYDVLPNGMVDYLSNYGRHFNKKLLEFALKNMSVSKNGKTERLKPFDKGEVDNILSSYGIELKNNQLLDYLYVANMCKADFLGSSIKDEQHLALYIKDVIDDVDAYDGIVFNRWYADTRRLGVPIEWSDML